MSNITSPVLQTSRRAADPVYPVWDLEGVKHMMTQPNINDKVRHCGWYQKDPASLMAQALSMKARAEALVAAAQRSQAAPGAPESAAQPAAAGDDGAMPRLTALRKELSDAGGIPDPTWGVAKLEQAIAAKKAGVPMPKDADDDE
jgi:hypothetical protein